MSKRVLVHQSEDLTVAFQPATEAVASLGLVVTFTPAIERGGKGSASGFAEAFLSQRGFDVLSFISARNHWWQISTMDEAIRAATPIRQRYKEASGYGISMGGYGALLFSKRLNLTRVLAVNPQFSIDPEKAPYEHRWLSFAKRLIFRNDDIHSGLNPGASILLIYDPFHPLDSRHIKDISAPAADRLLTSFSGHGTSRYLSRLGLFSELVLGYLSDGISAAHYIRQIKQARKEDAMWLYGAADFMIRRRRSTLAMPFALRLLGLPDDREISFVRRASLFRRLRLHNEAAQMLLAGDDPARASEEYQRAGMLFVKEGDRPSALVAFSNALRLTGEDDLLKARVERLERQIRREDRLALGV